MIDRVKSNSVVVARIRDLFVIGYDYHCKGSIPFIIITICFALPEESDGCEAYQSFIIPTPPSRGSES